MKENESYQYSVMYGGREVRFPNNLTCLNFVKQDDCKTVRKRCKRMTLAEIEEVLGHEVEIIEEDEDEER